MSLLVVAYLVMGGAVVTALALAYRAPGHRPVAMFLAVALLASLIRTAIGPYVTAVPEGTQLVGGARALFHMEEALFLLWPFGLAALASVLFARFRAWPVVPAWAVTVAGLVITYPTTRQEVLRRCYLAIELVALFVSVVAFMAFLRRRESPSIAHLTLMLIALIELGVLLVGPWRVGLFGRWDLAQIAYVILYLSLIVLQGGSLWITSSSRS